MLTCPEGPSGGSLKLCLFSQGEKLERGEPGGSDCVVRSAWVLVLHDTGVRHGEGGQRGLQPCLTDCVCE